MRSITMTCVTLASLISICPAVAQGGSSAVSQTAIPRPNAAMQNRSPQMESHPLAGVPQSNEIPQYTGRSEFAGGYFYPDRQRGASYTFMINAQETPQQVIEWYTAALQIKGWTISTGDHNPAEITAYHPTGSSFHMMVNQAGRRAFRSSITATYRQVSAAL